MPVEKSNKKWVARIAIDGKRVTLGSFKTKKEAKAVLAAAYEERDNRLVQPVKTVKAKKPVPAMDDAIYQGHDDLFDPVKPSIWQRFLEWLR